MCLELPLSSEAITGLFAAVHNRSWYTTHIGPASTSRLTALCDQLSPPALRDYAGVVMELGWIGPKYSEIQIPSGDILAALARGSTVHLQSIQTHVVAVDQILTALVHTLRLFTGAAQCNLYISGFGSGLPTHYDDHDVVVLQLEGCKTWWLCSPRLARQPTANHLYSEELGKLILMGSPSSLQSEWSQTILRPGGLMGVAAGVWHTTSAAAAGWSVSLTCGFHR